jgi:hypothetical protein
MKINFVRCVTISTVCIGLLIAGSIFSNTIPLDPDTFLTMLEKFVPEDAITETAYYDAVDPDDKKNTYADWLFETGFIGDPLDYSTEGSFDFRIEASVTSVTHQNVADLGFIRRVSARCEPSCEAPNPDIYSVIENYLTFDDAAARENRLASVTMEWASAADGTRPSRKFVTFYAYTGEDKRDQSSGVPFQPDLDGRGQKAIPGLCNTCHGGAPRELRSDGTYRGKGNTRSLFLPMDLDNFAFDPDRSELSRAEQEPEYKEMNKIVLLSRRSKEKFDEEAGIYRVSAGHELIEGWYGGPEMGNKTFDGEFVPAGWLPPVAPEGVDDLYLEAIAPACRSCHAQQKRELDFGTYDGFAVFEDAHKELVLSIECGLDDDSGERGDGSDDQAVMPLAKETYEIFWATGQADVFKDHFGAFDCSSR